MEKGFYKYYKDLPPYVKGALAIGVGVVLFLVGKKLYKVVFPSAEERRSRQMLDNIQKEIESAQGNGQRQSYSNSQYLTFANQIYEGMRYVAGDDYAMVEGNLRKMMNDLDVGLLIKAFGARQDYAFGIPTGTPKDLFTFVRTELGDDYGGLTSYRLTRVNEDWKKKGIKYKI